MFLLILPTLLGIPLEYQHRTSPVGGTAFGRFMTGELRPTALLPSAIRAPFPNSVVMMTVVVPVPMRTMLVRHARVLAEDE